MGFSHRQVGRRAAQYLLERGYRRVGFVHNSAAGDLSAQERYAGYAEVMQAAGLAAWGHNPSAADPLQAGAQALDTLLARRRQRPEALIFANDNLACGALLAGQRRGLSLPRDLAVFGFGDYAFADKLLPSLSTMRPPAREMGRAAVEIVRRRLAGEAELPHVVELGCEVVARESA